MGLFLAVAAAFAATTLDAVLLQLRRSYFTGGFLARDSAIGFGDRLGFVVSSWLADLVLMLPLVAVSLVVARRLRLGRTASVLAALAGAIGPLAVFDFISYQIANYLGDLLEVPLLFALVDNSLGEIGAIVAAYLPRVVGATLVGVLMVTGLVWYVNQRRRREAADPHEERRFTPWSLSMTHVAAGMLLGVATTTYARLESPVIDNGLRRKASGLAMGAVVDLVTDLDRDGFGLLGMPRDPALFVASTHPYAPDTPGNGIDEDGVGGDLPAGRPYREGSAVAPHFERRPPVVLILLESVRADVVGGAFHGRPITPRLDRLAARGLAVAAAYSHNGYTVQSRYHTLSGSLAELRGEATLVDDFKRNGYEVAYFSAQDESFGLQSGRFGVGFERTDVRYDARRDRDRRFSTFSTPGSLAVPASVLLQRIDEFLATRRSSRPLFLYVNFQDAHFPYHHDGIDPILFDRPLPQERIGPDRVDDLHATYVNTVANVDRAVGHLLERVQAALGTEPATIVLSDHGEALFDAGMLGHGYALDDTQTRIPFIITGLDVDVPVPFGQTDLRDMLWRALQVPQDLSAPKPRLGATDGAVFQYLGLMERPSQIALVTRNGRTTYDFRRALVKVAGSDEWVSTTNLAPLQQSEFMAVVHEWERVRLAIGDRAAGVP